MRFYLAILLSVFLAGPAIAGKIEFKGCSKASRQKIISGVNWLATHLADLDSQLGQGGLAAWSGGSRDRFARRLLKKKLRFSCHDPCDSPRFALQSLGTWSLYIGHGARIPICTAQLSQPEQTAAVIAHGLGHLVWINAHRRACHDRCLKPRLGSSLLHAVYHIAQGTQYEASPCLAKCGPIPGQEPTIAPAPDPVPTPKSEMPTTPDP